MIQKGRRALLLLDNCSTHGTTKEVESLNLSNTKILFLPPNTTSIIQPCDAGIIAALKCRYRRLQMGRALNFIDMVESNIYKVNVLHGMRWIRKAWEEMDIRVIRNCWCHTKVVGENVDVNGEMVMHRDRRELDIEIDQVVRDSGERMRVEYLLHHESEMQSTEPVTDRDLVSFITGPEEDSGTTEEGRDEEVFMPPLREQLRILASAHVIMSNYNASGAVLRGLAKVQRGLRCQVQEEFCQTRINGFLGQSYDNHASRTDKPLCKDIFVFYERYSYWEVALYMTRHRSRGTVQCIT